MMSNDEAETQTATETTTEGSAEAPATTEGATAEGAAPAEGSETPAADGAAAAPATDGGIGNRVRHELADKIFFLGQSQATDGTTYGVLQSIIAAHPDGLTAEQFTEAVKERSSDLFKKSTAYTANPVRHIRGYLVGGLKRKFLTVKVDEAAAALNLKKRTTGEKAEKTPKEAKEVKPRTSKNALELLQAVKSRTGEDGRALIVHVAETMKKTLKAIQKTIASAIEQGHVTEVKSEAGELVALVLTEKGQEVLAPAPAAATEGAATTEAPASDGAAVVTNEVPAGDTPF